MLSQRKWSESVKKAIVRSLDLPHGRRTLIVSDIHGNLPLLKGALVKAGLCEDDILIVLGDMVERSETSLETLQYVMELSKNYTVYTICGNCDNLVLDFVQGGKELPTAFFQRWFSRHGERCVLVKMAHLAGVPVEDPVDYPAAQKAIAQRFPAEIAFLESLPHILINDDYLLVHGGVPGEDGLEELDAFDCMKNDDFLMKSHLFSHVFRRWVVVGHTPVTLLREDIPSAAPIVDEKRHVVGIDGGCTLKLDGQLNVLILPQEPGGDFSWVSYDGFPEQTALDAQEPSPDPINIRWGHSKLEVLERGELLSRCRHGESGRVLDVLTEYLWEKDGETYCEDSTDYRLPVAPGDTLSVVRRLPDRALCKKDGVTGWYFGRLE